MTSDDNRGGSGGDSGPTAASKFAPDGTARHFPGNTIISFVPPGSPEAQLLEQASGHLGEALAADFVTLPPSSWHMTVFELLCDQVRDAAHWSRFLDLDAPLDTVDEFFAGRVPTVATPDQINMRFERIFVGEHALGVQIEPEDSATADVLREYRQGLSEATGVRFPNHDSYRFHVTLAYALQRSDGQGQHDFDSVAERAERDLAGARFAMPQPVLTYFSDMTDFAVDARPTRPE